MTYDSWKATNPDDRWLGPDPDDDEERWEYETRDERRAYYALSIFRELARSNNLTELYELRRQLLDIIQRQESADEARDQIKFEDAGVPF